MHFLTTLADCFFLSLWPSLLWAFVIGFVARLKGWQGLLSTFLLALVPVAAMAIYFGVSHASDESFLVAGVIPWSDAAIHFKQAAQMALGGITHVGMNGRFLYPAYFSSLLILTHLNLLHAEVLGGVLFAGGLTLALSSVARLLGASGAMVVALVCGLFFRERCAGLIMTENFGLLCGLLGLAATLLALKKDHFWTFLLGVFLLALGLSARPGPMFILPFLVIFAAWQGKRKSWSHAIVNGGIAALIILGAFSSNTLLSKKIYDGKVIVNRNFSFTLYGLLTGGKWSDALAWSHYNSELVMQENLKLLKEKPHLLIWGAARAYKEAISRRILFMFGHESRPATLLLILAIVGLIGLWKVAFLRPYAFCFTFIALGIILSIPFAPPWDAAERPFAVTVPFQAFFAAIGFSILIQWLFKKEELLLRSEPQKSVQFFLLIESILVFLLAVAMPLFFQKKLLPPNQFQNNISVCLIPGSFIKITPEKYGDFLHRLTPFLNHYPAEKTFFSKLPPEIILGIDWKSKNFDHCAVLGDVQEVTNFHYWFIDQRLLQHEPNQKNSL